MLYEDLPSNTFIFQNFHISYILNEGFVTQVTTLQITVAGFMMGEVSMTTLYNTTASCRIYAFADYVYGIAGGFSGRYGDD